MSSELRYIPISSLCEGCLSSDRKLTVIYDQEIKKFFRGILDSLGHIHQLSLCWECVALICRILKYIDQVKQAHQFLSKYVLSEAKDVNSLSNLKTAGQSEIIYIDNDVEETDSTLNDHVPFKIENTSDDPEERRSKPYENVVTVKIERQDDDFTESDALRVGDVLTDDETLANILSKESSDEFNESDDEPLEAKKKKAEVPKRKRGRPKKTECGETNKVSKKIAKRKEKCGVIDNARIRRKLRQLNVASGQLEMIVLTYKELDEERKETLSSPAFTRMQYRCYDCIIGFSHKSKLDNHRKKHEVSAGPMVCNVCGVRCGKSAAALAAHIRRHRVRWRCLACSSRWSRADVAADHAARAHGAPAPTHTCSLCGRVEATLGKLRKHVKSHGERQKCEICGKSFSDRTSLRTHLFIHKGEKEFACPQCDKKFLFKKAMEIHLVTHDQSANLYCHECDLNFKNKMSYYQHMKYNLKHIDPAKLKFACEHCDKKFAKASRLHEHNLGVHLKITPYRCTIEDCDVSYSSRPALRTHVRMCHRAARAMRNHVCDKCGKAYSTKKVLEGHIRTHTGERPFKCAHCPSTFGYEAALYNHNKLVHLKIKNRRVGEQQNAPPVPNTDSGVPTSVPHVPNSIPIVPNSDPHVPNSIPIVPNSDPHVPNLVPLIPNPDSTVPEESSGWQLTLNIPNETLEHSNVDIT